MKTPYNRAKTAWKIFEAALWAGAIPALLWWLFHLDIPTTPEEWAEEWRTLLASGIAAAYFGAKNWIKNTDALRGGSNFLLPIGFALVSGAMLSGCATGWIRPAVGDHSRTLVKFDERTAAGDETRITFDASGDAALSAAVQYRGQGPDPWELSVTGDNEVTSPQAQAIADGVGTFIETSADTLDGLVKQIVLITELFNGGGGGGGDSGATGNSGFRDAILQLLLDRFDQREERTDE